MPGEVLTGPGAETFAGFFGKLPTTGDFVSRGLPDRFRRNWDAWVTRHLAPRLRDGAGWPAGGLRFRLVSGGRIAAGVIVPGEDSAGRLFPLSLILIGPSLPAPDGLDPWCDAAALAAKEHGLPDPLWDAIDALPQTEAGDAPGAPALLLWARGQVPHSADPADPSEALAALVGRVSSG